MVEQLTYGDLVGARVGQLELRQMVLDRVVQVQQPGVDELHQRERGERLAQRGDAEQRVAGHRLPGGVVPVATHHQHPVAARDRDGGTGDGRILHLRAQEPIDLRDHRARPVRVGPRGAHRCRSEEQYREKDGDRGPGGPTQRKNPHHSSRRGRTGGWLRFSARGASPRSAQDTRGWDPNRDLWEKSPA